MFKKIKQKLLKLFGYDYLLNLNTGEVHNLNNKKFRCRIELIADKNKKFITKNMFSKKINTTINGRSVNGCRFCNPKTDSDKKFKK